MVATTLESSPRTRRYEPQLTGFLHPGLPFYVLLGLPLFWLLGLGYFAFVLAAVPMGLGLLVMKPIRVPRGFNSWLLFIGWMLLSTAVLEFTPGRLVSFGIRAVAYIAATIIFLYVYNVPQRYLPTGRALGVMASIFVFTAVVGGYLGLLLGEVRMPTPFSLIVPQSLLNESVVNNVVRPPFAQTQDFLGYPLNRPSMPFAFTNDWAATLVPGTFIAIAAAGRVVRQRRLLTLVAWLAAIPMIISANRGMWIALLLGVVYVAVRRASSGQALLAIRLVLVLTFALGLILVSPLGDLVGGRTTSSHSIDARSDIYSDVIEAVPESPILGFGAPVANPNPNRPAIGTHGMFWTALFSHGVPGVILYVGFWAGMTFRTGVDIRNQEHLWLHLAVASSLPTMFFYDHLPAALPLMMIAAAIILRDRREGDLRRAEAVRAENVATDLAPMPVR